MELAAHPAGLQGSEKQRELTQIFIHKLVLHIDTIMEEILRIVQRDKAVLLGLGEPCLSAVNIISKYFH